MSKRLYLHVIYEADITADEQARVLRVNLARETGWTLEYIDSLPLDEIGTFFAVIDAQHRIEHKSARVKR